MVSTKKIKLLFLCKKRNNSYGISFGLLNSCTFIANALNKECKNVEAKVLQVTDNNGIDKDVHNFNPTCTIIEALWVVPEKLEVLLKKYPKVKWVVRLHSKATFLSNEGIAFEWLHKYQQLGKKYHNLVIGMNEISFREDLAKLLDIPVIYLPNIYLTNKHHLHKKPQTEFLNIGCFGAIRPLKNHLQQAVAAIKFADDMGLKLLFHINATRIEQRGDVVLKNLRSLFGITKDHKLVEHGWYDHPAFIRLVQQMDLGMQLSFSETFNIVAADFANYNIPVIVSPEITWASSLYQCSATNTIKIVDKLKFAYKFRNLNLQYLNKVGLKKHNTKALNAWFVFLDTL